MDRGIVPCAVCGAPGAGVREVDGKKHFLCARCAFRGRWKVGVAVVLVFAAVAAIVWAVLSVRKMDKPSPKEESDLREIESLVAEAEELIKGGKLPEARERIRKALGFVPDAPGLHYMMAQILRQMSYFESSIPHWLIVSQREMAARDEGRLELGSALMRMGRVTEAIRFLEKPFEAVPLERARQLVFAECDLELELYPEALKVVQEWPPLPGVARLRHRALSYLGRPDEARKAVEALEGKTAEERHVRAMMEVSLLREEGDFAAAGKALESAAREAQKGSSEWARIKRSEIALRIESGEDAALMAVVDELSGVPGAHVKGVAQWGRAIALLQAGKKEEAGAAALEFLSRTDPEYTPLRMERVMMLHLAGKVKDEIFEAEVRVVPRGWQNDMLYYLALARGDRSVAERALQATPGRNFPYHAIRRLLAR